MQLHETSKKNKLFVQLIRSHTKLLFVHTILLLLHGCILFLCDSITGTGLVIRTCRTASVNTHQYNTCLYGLQTTAHTRTLPQMQSIAYKIEFSKRNKKKKKSKITSCEIATEIYFAIYCKTIIPFCLSRCSIC